MRRRLEADEQRVAKRHARRYWAEDTEGYYWLMRDALFCGELVPLQDVDSLRLSKVTKSYISGVRIAPNPWFSGGASAKLMYRGSVQTAYSEKRKDFARVIEGVRTEGWMPVLRVDHSDMAALCVRLVRRRAEYVRDLGYTWLLPDLWRVVAAHMW